MPVLPTSLDTSADSEVDGLFAAGTAIESFQCAWRAVQDAFHDAGCRRELFPEGVYFCETHWQSEQLK